MSEQPLVGIQSIGVVRVGETVRRPPGPNAEFVRALLRLLEQRGFDGAPRLLGRDERGRDVLTYVEGRVRPGNEAGLSDEEVASAARLIRDFHDATAGRSSPLGRRSSCTQTSGRTTPSSATVARLASSTGTTPTRDRASSTSGTPPGASPEVGPSGGPVERQAARTRAFCDAYGWDDPVAVVAEIERYHRSAQARHEAAGRLRAAEIFAEEVAWIAEHGPRITAAL